jgi:CheY-like chemotaxis protein
MSEEQSQGVSRVLIVEESKLTCRMIGKLLADHDPAPLVTYCTTGAEALNEVRQQSPDLVITALRLPDMDGGTLAGKLHEAGSHYFPVVAVSGDVTRRLHTDGQLTGVTDYFDKREGFGALKTFVDGYIAPSDQITGTVLLVEDSKVVAVATRRMLTARGIEVRHVLSVTDALAALGIQEKEGIEVAERIDAIISDNYLENNETGGQLLERLRDGEGIAPAALPVIVVTGDDNLEHRAELLRAGANDLIGKPIDAERMIAKLRYQLRIAHHHRHLAENSAGVDGT